MKYFGFYYFFTVALVYLALYGVPAFKQAPPDQSVYAAHPTKEQRVSHMVQFYDRNDRRTATCSATAIGPHAFLTAEHCTEGDKATSVSFDLAVEKHILVAVDFDGRDHAIWLVTGTPFVNIETVVAEKTKVGESAVFYGDGERAYPPIPHAGVVTECYDPSDMDEQDGIFCFSMQPIPGDSGSAVYNSKGQIVGLVTYSSEDGGIGFGLNYSPEALKEVAEFDGKLPQQEPSLEDLIQGLMGGPSK